MHSNPSISSHIDKTKMFFTVYVFLLLKEIKATENRFSNHNKTDCRRVMYSAVAILELI